MVGVAVRACERVCVGEKEGREGGQEGGLGGECHRSRAVKGLGWRQAEGWKRATCAGSHCRGSWLGLYHKCTAQ